MSGTVRLWLSVYEKRCPSGASELWTRAMVTDFAPREGDQIHLSVSEDEEREDECEWPVRSSFWSHDGSYNANLTHLVVDPDDSMRFDGAYARAWRTEQEGDRPEAMLRRGGWQTWSEWRAQGRVSL